MTVQLFCDQLPFTTSPIIIIIFLVSLVLIVSHFVFNSDVCPLSAAIILISFTHSLQIKDSDLFSDALTA